MTRVSLCLRFGLPHRATIQPSTSSATSSWSSSSSSSSFVFCHRSLSSLRPFEEKSIVTNNETIPTFLIFGANTDVGKTVVSAGLVRSSVMGQRQPPAQQQPHYTAPSSRRIVHYIKPLQCGRPYDETFVMNQVAAGATIADADDHAVQTHTLFCWETPASPHIASRQENLPASDDQVLRGLHSKLQEILLMPSMTQQQEHESSSSSSSSTRMIWIETAGGVLSPSSASPHNNSPHHARGGVPKNDDDDDENNNNSSSSSTSSSWGWTTQGDLYQSLGQTVAPVILVGDGRLGGISATLSALESLEIRGYQVAGLILLETHGYHKDNVTALREYAARRYVFSTKTTAPKKFQNGRPVICMCVLLL
jgi:bifunctional dethiobiotin synthetase / adenosylmethionine---8-amino-7-oxononanoate aminotransferase